MRPLNNVIHHLPSVNPDERPLPDNEQLRQEWQDWSKEATPGIGEFREIAFQRFKECLKYAKSELNLQSLNLTNLPKNFPPSVKILFISYNYLTSLLEQQLPELTKLFVSNNQLTELPANLPDSLKIINAQHNFLSDLPENLPVSLQGLDISHNQINQLSNTLPESIQELYVHANSLENLPDELPASLKILNANNNQLTYLPNKLPFGLKELYANYNKINRLPPALPSTLEVLALNKNQLAHLTNTLPISLKILELNANQLKRLPYSMPKSLQKIDVSNNRFVNFPYRLPHRLNVFNISNNRLTELPKELPCFLKELNLSYNQLSYLPDSLPHSLKLLYINNNILCALSETLPLSLQVLNISNNLISLIPENLPQSLLTLNANNNRLTCLPSQLPAALQRLYVNNNQIRHMPDTLPSSLHIFEITNNQLINFTHHWPPRLRELHMTGNRLPHFPDNLPISISILSTDFIDPPLYPVPSDFLGRIRFWNPNIDSEQWKKIESEENATIFGDFLEKLSSSKNNWNQLLRIQIVDWLNYLSKEENTEIRKLTFLVAQEAIGSCVDRASFYFNTMHTLMIGNELTKPGISIETLFETNRGLFRLCILEKIATEQATKRRKQTSGFQEDIEIYLSYLYELRDILSLPIHTQVQYDTIARITEEELQIAKDRIIEKETNDFLRYLFTESSSWNARLEKWNPCKKQTIDASYLEEITSHEFEKNIDAVMIEKNIPIDDNDARHTISKKIADDLLFEKRYQLSKEWLTEKKALGLIIPFDPKSSEYISEVNQTSITGQVNLYANTIWNKIKKI